VDADIRDYSGALDMKLRCVYVIVYQDGFTIKNKLKLICDSFQGKTFEVP